MSASDWITRSVSRLRPGHAPEGASREAAKAPRNPSNLRPLTERLDATLRRPGEALAPRALRRALQELQAVEFPNVFDVAARTSPPPPGPRLRAPGWGRRRPRRGLT